jgi:hypothetical protein
MLKIKCIYFLKRLLITILAFFILALVETAPDNPLFFFTVTLLLIASIRFLWISILRDEKAIKTKMLNSRQQYSPNHIRDTNRAAKRRAA